MRPNFRNQIISKGYTDSKKELPKEDQKFGTFLRMASFGHILGILRVTAM